MRWSTRCQAELACPVVEIEDDIFRLLRSLSVIEFIEPSIHSQYESATLLFVAISVQRVRIGARVLLVILNCPRSSKEET
jgi:hypothetical protein